MSTPQYEIPRVDPADFDRLAEELHTETTQHIHEIDSGGGLRSKLNWLRAAVLGANDGLTSTAGIILGVMATAASNNAVLIAGVAGLTSGAVSMALGEYVSVSTQRDTEKALLHKERRELTEMPRDELLELADLYQRKGVSRETALRVALELHANDPVAAHMDAEHGIDPDDLTNPWQAALSSALSFVIGALIPLLAIYVPGVPAIASVLVATAIGFVITGIVSASLGNARRGRAVARLLVGGALAMAITYGIGVVMGVAVG